MWVKFGKGGSLTLRPPSGTPRVMTFDGGVAVSVPDDFGVYLIGRPDFVETIDPAEYVADVIEDDLPVQAYKEDLPTNHAFVSNRNEKACVYELHDGSKCGEPPEDHLGYVAPVAPQKPKTSSAVTVSDLTAGGKKTSSRSKRKAK